MNLFVGNLSYDVTEDDLIDLFKDFGEVKSTKIIVDRETHRARGFGFVDMPNVAEAQEAMQAVNGQSYMGRVLNVNEARPAQHSANRGFSSGDSRRPYQA